MMSEYQLVVVKEAQELSKFELLEAYVKHPLKTPYWLSTTSMEQWTGERR